MGWIRSLAPTKLAVRNVVAPDLRTKESVEHVEDLNSTSGTDIYVQRQDTSKPESKYPFQPPTVSDEDLPFIISEEVVSKRRPGALSDKAGHSEEKKDYWIVVDDIVYDCTFFVLDHPGGEQVILSFVGENCSWQFWRFHGKNEMEQYGKELRIGRTNGIANRFNEPVRFVGLSRFGDDDW